MAARGMKPKPQALRLIEGTKQSHPPIPAETIANPDPLANFRCPKELGKHATWYWNDMIKRLNRLGLISELDRAAFMSLCESYGEWRDADDRFKEFVKNNPEHGGFMVRTLNGWGHNPMLGARSRAKVEFGKLCAEFGLTPSARSRVSAMKPKDDKKKKQFLT
jgi:P27 family predicted phage terminase small subunit